MLTKTDLMYDLPEELIAQHPPETRGTSRLMVLHRESGTVEHTVFREIAGLLSPKDALVLNDTRVINARLKGERIPSGGKVELLLLEEMEADLWKAMIRPGRRCLAGNQFSFDGLLEGTVVSELGEGRGLIRFSSAGNTAEVLRKTATLPIPPYIKRAATTRPMTSATRPFSQGRTERWLRPPPGCISLRRSSWKWNKGAFPSII